MKKYIARVGATFNDKLATTYGRRIEVLMEESNKDSITSEEVLEDAKNPESPLHKAFEWDDRIGAARFRLYQAMQILNHLEIRIIVKGEKKARVVRAFPNIYEEGERIYVPITVIAGDEKLKGRFLKMALKEAQSWADRYKNYHELIEIFSAIKQTVKKVG